MTLTCSLLFQAVDALLGEILTTFSKLDWLIGNTETVLKPEIRPSNLLLAHKRCRVFHRPLGVVAACVSWVCYSNENAIICVSMLIPLITSGAELSCS